MTDTPDSDQTREIHLPPSGPTRQFQAPPPAGPTRQMRTPPPPRPGPGPGPHNPPLLAANSDELPWWQTINRDRPPVASPPAPPRQPPPRRQPLPIANHPIKPPPSPIPAESRTWLSQRNMLIAATVVVAVSAAVAVGATLGSRKASSAKVLDIGKAQQGVTQVLIDPVNGYGVTTLGSVACNNGTNPVVQQGNGFTCDVVVDGVQRHVAVVFQDDVGTYAVDRPR